MKRRSRIATANPSSRMAGVARGSAINLVGGAVAAISTFALTIVLARSLSPRDVGVFFTATSIFLILTALGQLGTSTGLVYFLGREDPSLRRTKGRSYLFTASVPVLVVASLTCTAVLVLAPQVSSWFGSDDDHAMVRALWALALFTPLTAILDLHNSAMRGLGTMRPTAVLDQMARPVLQLVLVTVAVWSETVPLVVLAWALPYLPTAVASRWWWLRKLGPARHAARESGLAGAFWRFTAPRALASVAQLGMQRLDIVLVAALAGLREAAIYTAATRFLVLGQLVGTAISRAVQPSLARAIGTRDQAATSELYRTATAWLVLLAWPLYLVMALASTTILRLFGEEYTAGATVVVILSLTMLVATGCGMVDAVLIMAGRTAWNLYNVVFALTVMLVADILLIPAYGITGAAFGWSAGILCANLIPLAQVFFAVHVHPFGRATLVAMAVTSVCFGVLPLAVSLVAGDGLETLLASLLAATLIYAAVAWWGRRALDLTSLVAGLRRSQTRTPASRYPERSPAQGDTRG